MMVVLSTVAAAGSAISPLSMLESIGLLVFFLIICFIIGIYFLPTFFKKTRQYFNDETLLIVSLGLCLSMVVLASKMGFSSALGAFLMGTLLSGTIYTRRTKVLLEPVKNLFSGIFFVSVGMMVDPSVVSGSLFTIIALAITLIIGKCIFTSLGVMLSGQPLKTSMRCGFSLTQLGEFAFIVANIGASYGLTSSFLYPVFVTVSVLTIFLTPHILLSTDKVYRRFLRRLPKKTAVMLIEAHRDNKKYPPAVGLEGLFAALFHKNHRLYSHFNFHFLHRHLQYFAVLPQRYTAAFRRFISRCRDTAFHVAVFGGTDGKPFGTARFDGRFMV